MTVVARFEVLPLYAQVEVRDPAAVDLPEWENGNEQAIATAQCVAVATRSDVDGLVSIEVWQDEEDVGSEWALVFAGELLLTGPDLVVGNVVANEVHPVPVGPGWHRICVWVRPSEGRPAEVVVVLGTATA
jgi:hypothetical protein